MLELLKGEDLAAYQAAAREVGIPERMAEGYWHYAEHGILPGDFLLGVLINDFERVVFHVDRENSQCLRGHVLFCVWCLLPSCYGSPQKVTNWIKHKEKEKERCSKHTEPG